MCDADLGSEARPLGDPENVPPQVYEALDVLERDVKERAVRFEPGAIDLVLELRRIVIAAHARSGTRIC